MTDKYAELKAAAEVTIPFDMRVRGMTILALLAEREQLLKIAEAANNGVHQWVYSFELRSALKEWKK